jgi:hypothetical protein
MHTVVDEKGIEKEETHIIGNTSRRLGQAV